MFTDFPKEQKIEQQYHCDGLSLIALATEPVILLCMADTGTLSDSLYVYCSLAKEGPWQSTLH